MKHVVRVIGVALFAAVMISAPLFSARKFIDSRNEKRAANASQVAAARSAASAAAVKVEANAQHIEALADTARKTCQALNTDAARLNKVLDYFELYVKLNNPGPGTDRFFDGLPRPTIIRCTPKRSHAP